MELGIVGLGRMGANMARRLMRDGHRIVVYDVNPAAVSELAGEGAEGAASLEELAAKLSAPRAVWVMVPSGEITEKTVEEVAAALEPGDAIIDGGNSYYRDDIRRAGDAGGEGDRLRRLRHQRRRLRPRARLLPDDRRAGRGGRSGSTRSSPRWRRGSESAERTPGRSGDPSPPRTATCTAGRTAPGTS